MSGPVIVDETATERPRLVKLVALGLALVLLAVVLPRVLLGGGDEVPLDVSTPTSATADPAALPSTTSTTVAEPPVPDAGRNPFGPPTGSAVAALPSTTSTTVAPAPPVTKEPERFELVDVYTDPAGVPSAKVRLDGTQMTVKSGEDFASSFRTMSLDLAARCGRFLHADVTFSLCVGEGRQL